MLSLFPSLLTFAIIGPFLLRFVLGATILHFAFIQIRQKHHIPVIFGGIQAITALLLIIGLATQLAAFIVVLILGLLIIKKIMNKAFLTDGVNYYLILLVIAVSLILTGPGKFAFDYPL